MNRGSVEDSFTFVGGLHTEGGFLLTPKDSWIEGTNVIPQTDGSFARRKALDFETLGTLHTTTTPSVDTAFMMDKWKTVGGNGSLEFFVVQNGATVHFFEALGDATSSRKKSFTINLNSYSVYGNTDTIANFPIEITNCYGNLIITSQCISPLLVSYNSTSDTIAVKALTLQIRDFTGLYRDSTSITTENTQAGWGALYPAVLYNLCNQGWSSSQIAAYQAANSSKLPADTKNWINGKNASDDFDAALLNKQDFGTSPAPRGRFILDAFYQARGAKVTAAGYSLSDNTTTTAGYQDNRNVTGAPVGATSTSIYINFNRYRPRTCAFFAGRAWYAGVNEGVQSSWVMFSAVATDTSKLEECYQSNDPTAEVISDVEDDDGGVIPIPDAGQIYALRSSGNALLVFASNGVWAIAGGDQGFKATSYIVNQITSIGVISAQNIVPVEDTYLYWALNGIYAIKVDSLGEGTAQNISDAKIKSMYATIPVPNKIVAQGSYDETSKVVYWLYNTDSLDEAYKYHKNAALCFDVRLQSWYTFSFSTGPLLVAANVSSESIGTATTYDVYVGTDDVNAGADDVVADIVGLSGGLPVLKYLFVYNDTGTWKMSFADTLSVRTDQYKFRDWYGVPNLTEGVEPAAYVVTGYGMGGNGPARSKTGGYISVLMRRTEVLLDGNEMPDNESGVLMSTRWDFTDNAGANKWSAAQQVYRQNRPLFLNGPTAIEDGYPLVITKNKLRGRGKAVQLKFEAEAGKDMQMVGWTATFVGNTNV